jgi:hypothetical protein
VSTKEEIVMTEHGMRILIRLAMIMASPLVSAPAARAQTAFEATVKGARCTQNSQGSRLCRFEVGADLIVSITAVGEPDAGISFLRSNIEGEFFARTAIQHDCVIVSAGVKAPNAAKAAGGDLAFISPRTGRVYRTWQECETAQS